MSVSYRNARAAGQECEVTVGVSKLDVIKTDCLYFLTIAKDILTEVVKRVPAQVDFFQL